jgi:LexA-binding, inner membrane-associated putative hydrolase
MMAAGHTEFNFANGLALGDSLALPPLVTLTVGVCLAGAGTLPDNDSKNSTVTTAFGPFSLATYHITKELHHVVASSLQPDYDFDPPPHRGITHWYPWWIVFGIGVWAGCHFVGQWFAMGVIAILFALAARGLTIPDVPTEPQDRFADSLHHEILMKNAYRLLWLCPFTWLMRIGRKRVDRKRNYGWWIFRVRFGIGKVMTLGISTAIAGGLTIQGTTAIVAPWLGLIVGVGMFLHWIGDSPTHMGVPGVLLHHKWKLPFWASFYAGGPFEVACIWFTFGWLNIFLLLGAVGILSHAFVMQIVLWGGIGLGVLMITAIVVEATQRTKQRRYT